MITTKYEDTYISVKKARDDTADLERVIQILSKASEPMTCHDIGFTFWGVGYLDNRRRSAHLGQILKHLRQGGFIHVDEIDGEPVEVEREEYRRNEDKNGNPRYIKVHDDAGNEYEIPNPKYRGYSGWIRYKETIIPRIKVYSLVR